MIIIEVLFLVIACLRSGVVSGLRGAPLVRVIAVIHLNSMVHSVVVDVLRRRDTWRTLILLPNIE